MYWFVVLKTYWYMPKLLTPLSFFFLVWLDLCLYFLLFNKTACIKSIKYLRGGMISVCFFHLKENGLHRWSPAQLISCFERFHCSAHEQVLFYSCKRLLKTYVYVFSLAVTGFFIFFPGRNVEAELKGWHHSPFRSPSLHYTFILLLYQCST